MLTIDWQKIEPHDFEFIIADCFSKLGYSIVQTKLTVDGGVDVIADKFDEGTKSWLRFVVQVKRYKKPVQVNVPRELNGVLADFKAVKGIVIGTSGFTKSAKEYESTHLNSVSLWGEKELLDLLNAAKLIDAEGNLRKASDPNLKGNRLALICMVLRQNRPDSLNVETVAEALRDKHKVIVPTSVIAEDLNELAKQGDIVELTAGAFCPRVLETEVSDICKALENQIPFWDFHFDVDDLTVIVSKQFQINDKYVRNFLSNHLVECLNNLRRKGIITIIGDRYITQQGLRVHSDTRLTKEQMFDNLLKFFNIEKKDLEKPLTSIVTMNKAITLLDKNNPRKRLLPLNRFFRKNVKGVGNLEFISKRILSYSFILAHLSSLKIK